ncbi:MAG TPA: 1,4-alpha-glucan branching enzyme, partial [Opitutae bacterium]|nr:1,4-alpha-glucan branching enzyme [Opitutae bacterium]
MHLHDVRSKSSIVVRAFLDDALTCEVVDVSEPGGQRYPLKRLTDDGFFEGVIPKRKDVFAYRLRIERYNGEIRQFYDPYSFLPSLSDNDIYLFNEGNEHQAHNKMGAQLREL